MRAEVDVGFHNKFVIERLDAKTLELKQKGFAENMILDRCFDRVCQFASYFSYIHYGDGDGEVLVTDKILSHAISYKSATTVDFLNAYPTSHVTKMIELGTQDNNGKELSEVGISESTTEINTHAFIKDAAGKILTIPKTKDDIIRIYATAFVTFVHPSENFKFINFPNNAIAKYFIDHTNPSNDIVTDRAKVWNLDSTHTITSSTGAMTIGDKDNRRIKVFYRFLIAASNAEIRGIGLQNSLKFIFPNSDIFMADEKEGVNIGVGDGETTDFPIPNTDPFDVVVKKNDNIVSENYYVLKKQYKIESVLQSLASVGNNGYGVALSSDGKLIVTASDGSSPYFTVQKLNEDTGLFEYVQSLASVGNKGCGVALSSDGKLIVTASDGSSPYFTVQKLNEDTGLFEYVQSLASVGNNGYGVALSSDGKLIVTASYSSSPYFTVQKLNEDTGLFEYVQSLASVGNTGYGVALSSDGKLIVTASYGSSPYFTVQKLNEDTGLFEYVQSLASVGNNGYGVALSSDGKLIVTASDGSSPYFTVQKLNEDTGLFEYVQSLASVGNTGYGVALSSDGKLIVTASYSSPYFTVQKLNEDTGLFEYVQSLASVGNTGYGVALSSDGKLIVTASYSSSPYFTVQKLNVSQNLVSLLTPPLENDLMTVDYKTPYIPKDDKHELEVEYIINLAETIE